MRSPALSVSWHVINVNGNRCFRTGGMIFLADGMRQKSKTSGSVTIINISISYMSSMIMTYRYIDDNDMRFCLHRTWTNSFTAFCCESLWPHYYPLSCAWRAHFHMQIHPVWSPTSSVHLQYPSTNTNNPSSTKALVRRFCLEYSTKTLRIVRIHQQNMRIHMNPR